MDFFSADIAATGSNPAGASGISVPVGRDSESASTLAFPSCGSQRPLIHKKNLNSIGVRDGVGGQGQYWLFHYQKSDFWDFEKSLSDAFLVGWAKIINIVQ